MTENDIKKLSRGVLLEILVEQTKERETEKEQFAQLQEKMKSREIKLSQAGSIAEAALQLNGVFEAAQEAAKQYLENIERLDLERQVQNELVKKEAREEAELILAKARVEAAEIMNKAKEEANQYWTEVSEKLEKFYLEHKGLRELLKYMEMKIE